MKKITTAFLMVAVILLGLNVNAQEQTAQIDDSGSGESNGFRLGLGLGYRNFHTLKLKGAAGRDFVGLWAINGNPDNMVEFNRDSVKALVDSVPGMSVAPANITTTHSYNLSGHGHWGNWESTAPVLSLEFGIWQDDNMSMSLIGNFQYYDMDSSAYLMGSSVGEVTETGYIYSNGSNWGRVENYPFTSTETSYLTTYGKTKFDMQMVELDCGAKLDVTLVDNLNLQLATGPSLTIADMDSSCAGRHSDDTDWIFGVYVSGGANFWFNETVGLSLDVRYDEAFNHAATRYANLNLDSWSSILKLMVQF